MDHPDSTLQEQRDSIATDYFDALPYAPYPVQEEALLAWFTSQQGVMVCAPTGTGKTLIAEAAVFEALRLGRTAYYTTPLIALTDQKFRELQAAAARWGFHPDDVGLATGNRKINPDAPIQVVVAEILLNRLLHREAFDFTDVWAVVMDEFHSFNDPERGVVWEFGLALLPPQVRTLLLSATVGNAHEFSRWLETRHGRSLTLVESLERKVPLAYRWVGDLLLDEQIEEMFVGTEDARMTPALVFCFNREQCWTVAELLKGKKVVTADQQQRLGRELEQYDWSRGAGPKLKQILLRGIGVHHAGVMPRYRRIVEHLFQQRLLSICVCTETLAAGINLPARSVVLPTLLKGPPGKMRVIEPALAHQMFGRAGRPQFDDRGFVFALAHEDDVRILRWQEKMKQIPEDTKDPGLLRARKELKKKQPHRREGVQYWNEAQFQQLVAARSGNLESRGPLPWRLLAWLLDYSQDVDVLRQLVARRLIRDRAAELAAADLDRMLGTLWRAGYVELEPPPPFPRQVPLVAALQSPNAPPAEDEPAPAPDGPAGEAAALTPEAPDSAPPVLDLGQRRREPPVLQRADKPPQPRPPSAPGEAPAGAGDAGWKPVRVHPNPRLALLASLRSVHPLFGLFLMDHLALADQNERIQALECLLELTGSLGPAVEVPGHDQLPQGPLALERVNPLLLQCGLATADEIFGRPPEEEEDEPRRRGFYEDAPPRILSLPHKLQRLFQFQYPGVTDLRVRPCWVAGELLAQGGDFNHYIVNLKLQKQEGVIFRHLLRLVLLIDELAMICPAGMEHDDWKEFMGNLAFAIESSCRAADPDSTDQWLDEARKG